MRPHDSKPLLSFVIFAYNQESYIADAVRAAFAQDYSPLEIILSDDNSSDRTFAIMQELAAGYVGPHKVFLNRNLSNLGIGGHFSRVMELVSGELIVGAAGDDISFPNRATLMAEIWEGTSRRATSIHGRWEGIDHHGVRNNREDKVLWPKTKSLSEKQPITPDEFIYTLKPSVLGGCHAFAKRLFEVFGPIPSSITYEDICLAFRSALIGEIHFVDRPLIRYRLHENNVSANLKTETASSLKDIKAYHQQRWRVLIRYVCLYDSFLADVELLMKRGQLSQAHGEQLTQNIRSLRVETQLQLKLYEEGIWGRLSAGYNLLKGGYSPGKVIRGILRGPITEIYSLFRVRLKHFYKRS